MRDWRQEEKRVAKKVGGRVQPGSGCLSPSGLKEDVRSEKCLIQVKATSKKRFILKRDDLDKLIHNALNIGKTPVMVLTMWGKSFVITREEDFDWESL